jgi:hypothetical protein
MTDDSHQLLTPKEAYLAMYYIIDAYWERGGRLNGSVTLLRHAAGPEKTDPEDADALWTTDPAFWDLWLKAIEKTRTEGIPPSL